MRVFYDYRDEQEVKVCVICGYIHHDPYRCPRCKSIGVDWENTGVDELLEQLKNEFYLD